MIDIDWIRKKPEEVKNNLKKKFQDEKIKIVDEIIKLDKICQKLNYRKTDIIKKNKLIDEISFLLKEIPNFIHPSVPIGKNEIDNLEIKRVGQPKKFDFKPKNHVELIESLGVADFDSSAKTSGNGFYYLIGDLALLNQALIRFGIDFMKKKGYTYIETPLMLNKKSIYASMDKKAIEESVYSIEKADLNLIGTSEQSLLSLHINDIIEEQELPKKYFSYSMCFRKEIGSHGINEKGLWRTHQFNKIEQFIFCRPEDSRNYYKELLENSEQILRLLNLPYRVLNICSGDLANWKNESIDLEVWRPPIERYGEVVSLSNCTDYQARELEIYCKNKLGQKRILHTLNDTAIATSRIMVAILENNQNEDGSIDIPENLQFYMLGKKKIIKQI